MKALFCRAVWCGIIILVVLAGCAGKVAVPLPAHQASSPSGWVSEQSALAKLAPRDVVLGMVEDVRPRYLPGGTRQAAFGVPMGDVEFKQKVADVVRDVLAAEFRAAGLTVKDGRGSDDVTAKVHVFNVRTDTTVLYWDVIGNVKIAVAVPAATAPLEYTAQCTERTYVWPGEELIRTVMGKCTQDIDRQVRNDQRLANALK